jgi:hypothetical protein
MLPTPSQQLQQCLRAQQQQGELILPPLQRWEKGLPFWGELLYLSYPEAQSYRETASRVSQLVGETPQQGIQLCVDGWDLRLKLAIQINTVGYGGLVQFEDLQQDCFLRILVGQHLYPVIVAQHFLKDFWLQLTLHTCRHFLTVIDGDQCLGFWESDLVLPGVKLSSS